MIVVFGAKRCKHCKTQKENLFKTYGKSGKDWIYVDVIKEPEALKIAEDINIENIPAVVVFDKGREIVRSEGKMAPDVAFRAIHGGFSIPFTKSGKKEILSKKINKAFLSYDPKLNKGQVVKARLYNGTLITELTVESSTCTNVHAISDKDRSLYLRQGGRKDIAWVITLKKEK